MLLYSTLARDNAERSVRHTRGCSVDPRLAQPTVAYRLYSLRERDEVLDQAGGPTKPTMRRCLEVWRFNARIVGF